MNDKRTILFFDGECNLCNAWVQRVLKNETEKIILFSSLQSEFSKNYFLSAGLNPEQRESVVLFTNGRFLFRSQAALTLVEFLKAPWSWLAVLKFIPLSWRDAVYNIIAKNRYKWYGKKDKCVFYLDVNRERFLL